jgi:hypothetical protein
VLLEAVAHVAGLVVDAGIEAELVDHPVALGLPAGDADRPAAADLGHLADRLAHRAGGTGDDHRVARLRLPDVEQAEVRRSCRACRAR